MLSAAIAVSPAMAAAPISQADREALIKDLERSRMVFLDAIADVRTDAQWNYKPAPDRWSVAECAAHIIAAEQYFRDNIAATLKTPAEHVGQVTLKPVELAEDSKITINADARDGEVRVELLDEELRRVRGFSRDDATVVRGDSLRHAVTWKRKSPADLPPGRYHLRAHLDRAALFAVSITP